LNSQKHKTMTQKQNTFFAKRLDVILALYMIEGNCNSIIKRMADLNPDIPAEKVLHDYILNSKIMRIKPYLEKILTEIREITPDNVKQYDPDRKPV